MTMMDWITASIKAKQAKDSPISLEEFTRIRNEGTPEEIEAAVERMVAAGGYDNLE